MSYIMKFVIIPLLSLCLISGCKKNEDSKDVATVPFSERSTHNSDDIPEVEVIQILPSTFYHEIASNGKTTAHEKVDVNFQTQGLISEIFVKNGQHVAKGQKLASLDTYKLQNQADKDRNLMEAALLELQDVLIGQGYDPEHPENVPKDVMRLARLRSGVEQAETTLSASTHALQEATLVSPIGGVVANLSSKQYNHTSSEPFCRIINDTRMDVEFSIIESDMSLINLWDTVTISPYSNPDKTIKGHIAEINPMVNDNGMVKVWASADGTKGLVDGMNVRIRMKRHAEEALVVPKSAVVMRTGKQVIFTIRNGKAFWNYITVGLENLDQYTIQDGLHSGDSVIVSGNINLAHESPVRIISRK